MALDEFDGMGVRLAGIERRCRWWGWYIVYPVRLGEGMAMEVGPFLTRWGARWSRRLWGNA